jgi:hypothetical protein
MHLYTSALIIVSVNATTWGKYGYTWNWSSTLFWYSCSVPLEISLCSGQADYTNLALHCIWYRTSYGHFNHYTDDRVGLAIRSMCICLFGQMFRVFVAVAYICVRIAVIAHILFVYAFSERLTQIWLLSKSQCMSCRSECVRSSPYENIYVLLLPNRL